MQSERSGEAHDRALGGSVVDQRVASPIRGDGCGVDDRRALRQMRQCRPGHPEVRKDVGPEGALDLIGRDLGEILGLMLLGRVVDQHVDPAELDERSLDRLLAEAGVADVPRDRYADPVALLHQPSRLGRVFVLVQIADRHVGALRGEQGGHRAADPAVAARDERASASQLAARPAAFVHRFRLGAHTVLDARLALLVLGRKARLLLLLLLPGLLRRLRGHVPSSPGVSMRWPEYASPERAGVSSD